MSTRCCHACWLTQNWTSGRISNEKWKRLSKNWSTATILSWSRCIHVFLTTLIAKLHYDPSQIQWSGCAETGRRFWEDSKSITRSMEYGSIQDVCLCAAWTSDKNLIAICLQSCGDFDRRWRTNCGGYHVAHPSNKLFSFSFTVYTILAGPCGETFFGRTAGTISSCHHSECNQSQKGTCLLFYLCQNGVCLKYVLCPASVQV